MKSFCRSQFPHKSVNMFFTLVIIKDKSTNLCGNSNLQNDGINTFCEIASVTLEWRRFVEESAATSAFATRAAVGVLSESAKCDPITASTITAGPSGPARPSGAPPGLCGEVGVNGVGVWFREGEARERQEVTSP